VTAVVSNRELIDALAVVVQAPNWQAQEKEYLQMSAQSDYNQMAQVMQRLTELIAYQRNRLAYRKRTEIVRDIVEQLEREGEFPHAHYAFDNGVLTLELTQLIESKGKHWGARD
jgi:RecJ-like exonuclease